MTEKPYVAYFCKNANRNMEMAEAQPEQYKSSVHLKNAADRNVSGTAVKPYPGEIFRSAALYRKGLRFLPELRDF
jgi:hypothetical protein